jgi:hypothetical protein
MTKSCYRNYMSLENEWTGGCSVSYKYGLMEPSTIIIVD